MKCSKFTKRRCLLLAFGVVERRESDGMKFFCRWDLSYLSLNLQRRHRVNNSPNEISWICFCRTLWTVVIKIIVNLFKQKTVSMKICGSQKLERWTAIKQWLSHSVLSVYIIAVGSRWAVTITRELRVKIEIFRICLLYSCLIWNITNWKNNWNCLFGKTANETKRNVYIGNDKYRTRYLLNHKNWVVMWLER